MEMFCPQGGKAEPQPLSVWCAQRLPSNEDSVCVCVCGGARGLEQLRSGEAWDWSSFAVEKPGRNKLSPGSRSILTVTSYLNCMCP